MTRSSRMFGPGHIALLIAVAVIIGLLAACRPSTPTNDPELHCATRPDGLTQCTSEEK